MDVSLPATCPQCSATNVTVLANLTGERPLDIFRCDKCDAQFTSQRMDDHRRTDWFRSYCETRQT